MPDGRRATQCTPCATDPGGIAYQLEPKATDTPTDTSPPQCPTYRSPTASATIGLSGSCKSGRAKRGLRPETHQPDQIELKQAPVDSVRNPVVVMQCPVCLLSLKLIPISAVVPIPLLCKQNKRQNQRHARTPPRTVRKLKRTGHCTGQILLHSSMPKRSLHTRVGRS